MKGDLIMTLDEIKVVGIAGAGTMGASMAQIFAQYGYTVIIYDAFVAGLSRTDSTMISQSLRPLISPVKAEAVVSPDCILATNTSGLSINKIFANCKDKTRACGMHWFNPPHIVPLIEVINNDETKQEIADTVYQLSLKIGKKPNYVWF